MLNHLDEQDMAIAQVVADEMRAPISEILSVAIHEMAQKMFGEERYQKILETHKIFWRDPVKARKDAYKDKHRTRPRGSRG